MINFYFYRYTHLVNQLPVCGRSPSLNAKEVLSHSPYTTFQKYCETSNLRAGFIQGGEKEKKNGKSIIHIQRDKVVVSETMSRWIDNYSDDQWLFSLRVFYDGRNISHISHYMWQKQIQCVGTALPVSQ